MNYLNECGLKTSRHPLQVTNAKHTVDVKSTGRSILCDLALGVYKLLVANTVRVAAHSRVCAMGRTP